MLKSYILPVKHRVEINVSTLIASNTKAENLVFATKGIVQVHFWVDELKSHFPHSEKGGGEKTKQQAFFTSGQF